MFLYYSCYMSFFALTSRTRHTQAGCGRCKRCGMFQRFPTITRAHSVASTTCAVLASGGVRRHMGHGVTERMKKVWWSRFFVVYLQHQNCNDNEREQTIPQLQNLSDGLHHHLSLQHSQVDRAEHTLVSAQAAESLKVDVPEEFNPQEHIKGVRLHILPESSKGSPALYKGIRFEASKER